MRGEFKPKPKHLPEGGTGETKTLFQDEALEMTERIAHAQRDLPFAPADHRSEVADGVMNDELRRAVDRSLKATDALPLPGGCFRISGPFLKWDPKPQANPQISANPDDSLHSTER